MYSQLALLALLLASSSQAGVLPEPVAPSLPSPSSYPTSAPDHAKVPAIPPSTSLARETPGLPHYPLSGGGGGGGDGGSGGGHGGYSGEGDEMVPPHRPSQTNYAPRRISFTATVGGGDYGKTEKGLPTVAPEPKVEPQPMPKMEPQPEPEPVLLPLPKPKTGEKPGKLPTKPSGGASNGPHQPSSQSDWRVLSFIPSSSSDRITTLPSFGGAAVADGSTHKFPDVALIKLDPCAVFEADALVETGETAKPVLLMNIGKTVINGRAKPAGAVAGVEGVAEEFEIKMHEVFVSPKQAYSIENSGSCEEAQFLMFSPGSPVVDGKAKMADQYAYSGIRARSASTASSPLDYRGPALTQAPGVGGKFKLSASEQQCLQRCAAAGVRPSYPPSVNTPAYPPSINTPAYPTESASKPSTMVSHPIGTVVPTGEAPRDKNPPGVSAPKFYPMGTAELGSPSAVPTMIGTGGVPGVYPTRPPYPAIPLGTGTPTVKTGTGPRPPPSSLDVGPFPTWGNGHALIGSGGDVSIPGDRAETLAGEKNQNDEFNDKFRSGKPSITWVVRPTPTPNAPIGYPVPSLPYVEYLGPGRTYRMLRPLPLPPMPAELMGGVPEEGSWGMGNAYQGTVNRAPAPAEQSGGEVYLKTNEGLAADGRVAIVRPELGNQTTSPFGPMMGPMVGRT